MKEYDIYLFDFDGTLFDSLDSMYPTFRSSFEAIGMYGITDEEIESFTHMSLLDTMALKAVPPEKQALFVEKIYEALENEEYLKLIKPFPETLHVLEELKKRGKRLAIVSNNDTHHIHTVLRLLNIPDYFETVVGGDRAARQKPYPDMLFVVFDDMKVNDASKAVYVGDSIQDGETGRAGGIGSIVVDRKGAYDKVVGEKCDSLLALLNEN